MSKHTNGPWHWKRDRTMQSLWTGNTNSFDTTPLGFYVPMANNKKYVPEIRDSIEANARLIAAAPDMLAVLSEIVRLWNSPMEKAALKPDQLEAAKNAIAKAEGR